jgi:hypothetical protein
MTHRSLAGALLLLLALLAVVGCVVRDGSNEVRDDCFPVDDSEDIGLTFDGAPCDLASGERLPQEGEGEGEGPPLFEALFPECGVLLSTTCGADDGCSEDPGCRASLLLARHEPEGCAAALGDPRGFPACAQGSCDDLAQKVCGAQTPDGACEVAAGCGPARTLQGRADDGDLSARASCSAALTDEALFPPCQAP